MPSKEEHEEMDDDDISTYCFMVKDQQEQVTLNEDETSFCYDELQDFYENLMADFHKVLTNYLLILDIKYSLIKVVNFLKEENLIATN